MPRLSGLLCLLSITCGLAGCASTLGVDKSKPFRRGEQKEPFIETEEDDETKELNAWQKETTQMRGQTRRKPGRDGWLDGFMWSDQSQEIARSLNADL